LKPVRDVIIKYIKAARAVLEANRVAGKGFTMPSASLYPHQWNWDSGFIAVGYSQYDPEKAMAELTSLFSAQWKNGMLPHIVFDENRLGTYFPEPDFWQTRGVPNAPNERLTSGITMPPVHAFAALRIYENAKNKQRVLPFLRWIYPRLVKLHRYFYEERDPDGNGLAYIVHPWESGMDNSPSWDAPLRAIDLSRVTLPAYTRKDIETVSAEMRPTKEHYDYFVYLVDLFRRLRYDEGEIRRECPFLVLDPLFNAVLCASDVLGESTREAREWHERTARGIRERLFQEDRRLFDAWDLRGSRYLDIDTASGFLPLFGGAASEKQARKIYEYMDSGSFCALHQGNCFTIPSYDTLKEGFVRENYWRGPVWLNINWMLHHGLRRYGFRQKADSLARNMLELPLRSGFFEYFDSVDGRGYGTKDFSWTAALFLDVAYENYVKTGEVSIRRSLENVLWKDVVLNEAAAPMDIPAERLSQEMLAAVNSIRDRYYTPEGAVGYAAIRESREYERYKGIAANLRDFDLRNLRTGEERLAFWVNLYNTIVVDGVISLGVRGSVREAVGFFRKIKYLIGGLGFSPDDIEHGVLRANRRPPHGIFRRFGPADPRRKFSLQTMDPRIHFALVCGSRSCAPIKFYTPENIHAELEKAAANFINSSEVIVVPGENRMLLSSIFDWYVGDFGGREGILGFIGKYIADDDKKEFIRSRGASAEIGYLYYDWHLNR